MTEEEMEILSDARAKRQAATELLLQPAMHAVLGIREVREAVVEAQ